MVLNDDVEGCVSSSKIWLDQPGGLRRTCRETVVNGCAASVFQLVGIFNFFCGGKSRFVVCFANNARLGCQVGGAGYGAD